MADIAHSIAGSPEFIQDWGGKSDADVVMGLYYAALSRTPDAAGTILWMAMLQATGDRGAVLQGLANSPEGQAALGGVADQAGLLVSMADSTEARLVTSVQTHEGWVSLG